VSVEYNIRDKYKCVKPGDDRRLGRIAIIRRSGGRMVRDALRCRAPPHALRLMRVLRNPEML
jgi:hypothetical protein